MTRICAISDTHEFHSQVILPPGDILIHAGDSTGRGSLIKFADFIYWLNQQPFNHRCICFGNHEIGYDRPGKREEAIRLCQENNIICLLDSGTEIEGIHFYGSPWQPWFYDWAFNLPRGEELAKKWAMIPESTNVLITHGPPYGILDQCDNGERVGCQDLTNRLSQLPNLKAHIFGHIHHSYGMVEQNGVKFVNAATCTEEYKPTNPPIVIDI